MQQSINIQPACYIQKIALFDILSNKKPFFVPDIFIIELM